MIGGARARLALAAAAVGVAAGGGVAFAGGDELSGSDRLRVLWSNQMLWTPAGIPIVTVGIADGLGEVVVEGAGARLLPDGEGGAEVRGGGRWTVRLVNGQKSQIRWYVVVASGHAAEAGRLREQAAVWRQRGLAPTTLELGTVLGLRGEVIDLRRLLLAVSPKDSVEAARAEARAVGERFHVETTLQAVVAERPRGLIEARDERGTVVRSESVLWFAPASEGGTLAVPGVPREGQPPGAAGERREYAGRLYLTVGSDGKLAAANAVPEDRLLAGLLPAEIGAGAPPEALKAQAVAARNELYVRMGSRHLTDPYRLCSRAHCQVYAGAGHEDPKAQKAVEATRGQLLLRADGSLLDAVYSADCGGHTEDNERAWGSAADPALRGVLDAEPAAATALARFSDLSDGAQVAAFLGALPARPSCSADRAFRWSARVDGKAVEERAGVGRLREVAVEARGVSGRVVRLRIEGEAGKKEVKGELEVRRALGLLKSALFVVQGVDRDPAGFVRAVDVVGGGHGHGVGMCQAGAIAMADRSHDYRQILERYYRGATIKRFY